jgi:2-keto-4-pentenoate hydratase
MVDDRAVRAAMLLIAARQSGDRIAELPADCRPQSVDEAYAIQNAVGRRIGPILAWKTGAPSPDAEAAFAPIFMVTSSPARFPASGQKLFGIEAEVAFLFAEDLPRRGMPYRREEVVAAIASMHPVIELVDTRFADWTSVDPLSKLADNQSNGALIFGTAVQGWQDLELIRPPITITSNGTRLGKTKGNSGGDPLRLVTALVNHCAAMDDGLRAGMLVTSGSITGIDFTKPGTTVVADFGRLGTVRVDFPVE